MIEYITLGLVMITLGNLIYLERTVAHLKVEVKYLKRHLCGEKGGKELDNG